MEGLEIKERIKRALSAVLKYDLCLLQNDLNERTIAHKLATYLQCTFPEYYVDCEYNRNVLSDDGKKHIEILKNDLKKRGLLTEKEEKINEVIIERLVYPDIIIHKRDTTENLCIIEIKKSTSKISNDYDKLKLECYTSSANGNDLKYELGVFIKFSVSTDVSTNAPTYDLKWYANGIEIPEETLASMNFASQ